MGLKTQRCDWKHRNPEFGAEKPEFGAEKPEFGASGAASEAEDPRGTKNANFEPKIPTLRPEFPTGQVRSELCEAEHLNLRPKIGFSGGGIEILGLKTPFLG